MTLLHNDHQPAMRPSNIIFSIGFLLALAGVLEDGAMIVWLIENCFNHIFNG